MHGLTLPHSRRWDQRRREDKPNRTGRTARHAQRTAITRDSTSESTSTLANMSSEDGAAAASAAAAAAASTATPIPAESAAAAASSTAAAAAASSADDNNDSAAASAVPVVRMKKVRKRTAVKSSTTALDDDEDAAAAAGGAAADSAAADGAVAAPVATSLQTIRLMQKLRSKTATVLSLGEADLHLPEAAAASAAEWASASSAAAGGGASLLGKEFGAEGKDAQAALIDQQMEKYIAEQMAARRALRQPQKKEQEGSGPAPVNLSEDQLFVTPEHLKIQSSQPLEVEEESGERWLTGIAEYSLSIQSAATNPHTPRLLDCGDRLADPSLEADDAIRLRLAYLANGAGIAVWSRSDMCSSRLLDASLL